MDSFSCFFGLNFYCNTHWANNSVSRWMQLIKDSLPCTKINKLKEDIDFNQTEWPWQMTFIHAMSVYGLFKIVFLMKLSQYFFFHPQMNRVWTSHKYIHPNQVKISCDGMWRKKMWFVQNFINSAEVHEWIKSTGQQTECYMITMNIYNSLFEHLTTKWISLLYVVGGGGTGAMLQASLLGSPSFQSCCWFCDSFFKDKHHQFCDEFLGFLFFHTDHRTDFLLKICCSLQ